MSAIRILVRSSLGPCFALVDEQDAAAVSTQPWILTRSRAVSYPLARCANLGRHVQMHILIASRMNIYGTARFIDHINRNGMDNRRSNLRPADASQNVWNQDRKVGASGFPGVHRNGSNWAVRFDHRGSVAYLGTFKNLDDARLKAAGFLIQNRGEFLTDAVRTRCEEILKARTS